MARFWNGYQWRELADDRPREPELQVSAERDDQKAKQGEWQRESLLSRSMKPTRREVSHVHTFVNDVCACGEHEE